MISKELLLKGCTEAGLALSDEACDKFDLYAKLLVEYNEKVNLTAITAADDIVNKHFIDSLYLSRFVGLKDGMSICDVGTGAGFPGVALLIFNPSFQLTLFDSVNKKLDFIRFLLVELQLTARVVNARAETAGRAAEYREKFDLAVARAVAQLNILSEYCIPFIKTGGIFAPMKAPLSAEERAKGYSAAAKLGAVKTEAHVYEIPGGDKRELVLFKKNMPTPAVYPRNSAQISKKPL